jgi:hypothetical protein
VHLIDTYTMTLTASNNYPQVVGYKTRTFTPGLAIHKVSTHEFAYCRREEACATNTINLVALHRFSSHGLPYQSVYTTNYNEFAGNGVWKHDGALAYCFPGQEPNTIPLHRYVKNSLYFYTTNYNELGGGIDGWSYQGVTCYVYATQEPGTVPLYRHVNQVNDHALTTSTAAPPMGPPPVPMGGHMMNEIARAYMDVYTKASQWRLEGAVGYVSGESAIHKAIGCCKCD